MAITSNTRTRLVFGAGDFYINDTDVGATSGGTTFTVEQTIETPDLDGARGPVKGTAKVVEESATLQANLTEITVDNLALILPTVASDSDANSDYNTRPSFGFVQTSDHVTVKWVGQTMSGLAAEVYLYDAISDGSIEMAFADDGAVVYQATFMGYYDPADADKRMWEMKIANS